MVGVDIPEGSSEAPTRPHGPSGGGSNLIHTQGVNFEPRRTTLHCARHRTHYFFLKTRTMVCTSVICVDSHRSDLKYLAYFMEKRQKSPFHRFGCHPKGTDRKWERAILLQPYFVISMRRVPRHLNLLPALRTRRDELMNMSCSLSLRWAHDMCVNQNSSRAPMITVSMERVRFHILESSFHCSEA